jgi:hypothetical protein
MRDVRLDEDGEWVAPDGLPVMPGRPLGVARASAGPVRVLDIDPATVTPSFLDGLDDLDRAQAHAFNLGAYPSGGPQWDPVTRTLWCWGEPAEGPPRVEEVEAAASAGPGRRGRPEESPAPRPASPPAGAPAPAPPRRPRASRRVPAARRDDVEAASAASWRGTAAPGPGRRRLAEAVCALRCRTGRPTAPPSTSRRSAKASPAASVDERHPHPPRRLRLRQAPRAPLGPSAAGAARLRRAASPPPRRRDPPRPTATAATGRGPP